MRITAIVGNWVGNLFFQFANAFEKLGMEVEYFQVPVNNHSLLKYFYLHHITDVLIYIKYADIESFNVSLLKHSKASKSDWLFVMNESSIQTTTLKRIKTETNTKTMIWIADNPFDSSRFQYLPTSLKFFDLILVSDEIWIPSIRNVAPNSKILKIPSGGGYSTDLFFYDKGLEENVSSAFKCKISFTGESYHFKAEGGYRSQILDYISSYGLRIWGDNGWEKRFDEHPDLKNCYSGGRLSYSDLRKLYRNSTININMPAPQILTGFQPRVFEIAACKGFQIVDWREELEEHFEQDELVTFKSVPELKDKIEYYLRNPELRTPIVEKMYRKVTTLYTWEQRAKKILLSMKEFS